MFHTPAVILDDLANAYSRYFTPLELVNSTLRTDAKADAKDARTSGASVITVSEVPGVVLSILVVLCML